jgi:magnesium transporter
MGMPMHGSQRENYPRNSAARKMITAVPIARRNETVGNVVRGLWRECVNMKSIDYIYVIDNAKRLLGVVSVRELFCHDAPTRIDRIMKTAIVTAAPDTDAEKVADLAIKHNIKAVPVVSRKKILLGVVPNETILATLNWALRRDLLHFAGIHKAHLEYENTMAIPLAARVLHRLPWLLIGLFGIILAAGVLSLFETTIQKHLILASFVPVIVYMSDAVGVQNQTLLIRDLALLGKEFQAGSYVLRQMLTAVLLAVVISVVLFGVVSLFWQQPFVAFVIAASMLITLGISGTTALLVTLAISHFRLDPALGSGPIGTIISDVTSVITYLLVASYLLG